MRLPMFEFAEAESAAEACRMLAGAGPEAALLAGGTDLLVRMKRGLLCPQRVVSIRRLRAGRPAVARDGARLTIDPLATMTEIAADPLLREACANVAAGARAVGSPLIRNLATLGGNLASARPCADTAPPLLTWDASVRLESTGGERSVPLHDFFTGPGASALRLDELLVAVEIELPAGSSGSAFFKLGQRAALEIAIASAAARITLDRPGGIVLEARIALGSVAPVPLRARAAESLLAGREPREELLAAAAAAAAREARPIDDLRASAAYRREMVAVLVRRALAAALASAGGGQ
ncbi:MAG: FAD binding domain-containing protein [Planctomycetes bacterium]|nr:FAD binding domain-containing protein [Planctomycetota bacterium]